MKSILILALLLVSSAAQDKPDTPKFSAKSSYVLLPVLVTDNKGTPIYDLRQEDFVIQADNTSQPIASFEAPLKPALVHRPAPVPGSTPTTEFSNIELVRPRHVTIIALDPRNTPLDERKPTTEAVLSFLNKAEAANEPVAVIWLNEGRFEVIHGFSQDYAALALAVRNTKFPADTNFVIPIDTTKIVTMSDPMTRRMKASLQDQERQMQRQVEEDKANLMAASLSDVAARFGTIPGPKTLIWVTHGFRLRQAELALGDGDNHVNTSRGTATGAWEIAFRDLANANIAVYPIDARGLVAPNDIADLSDVDSTLSDMQGSKYAAQSKANHEYVTAMRWVAEETGGIAFVNSNGFEGALDRAMANANGAYMLSFRVSADAKPGWHPIKVNLQRKGVQVTTRPGFWIEKGKARHDPSDTIEAALTSPFALTGLPVMVRWTDVKPPNAKGRSQVGFQVAIPSALPTSPDFSQRRVSLQVRTAVFDSSQKAVAGTKRDITMDLDDANLQKVMKSAVSYSGVFELPAGEYQVAFAVKDNVSGRIGSAIAPLTVK